MLYKFQAIIKRKSNTNGIRGWVQIYLRNEWSSCIVEYKIKGLTDGLHGFHIHEKRVNEEDNDCMSTCAHFNPTNELHGYHIGDLCYNINSEDGIASGKFSYPRLNDFIQYLGETSIVIHKDTDNMGVFAGNFDSESVTTGKAGKRLACANFKRYY